MQQEVKDGKIYTSAEVAQIIWERDMALSQLSELGLGFGSNAEGIKTAIRKATALRVKAWKGKGGIFFAKCPCSPTVWIPIDKTCYCSRCGQKLLGIDDREKQMNIWEG